MKKLKYAVLGYMDVFNPETGVVEQQESVAYCIVDYSTEAEEKAKANAYNGDYEIFDDGEPEWEPTPTQLDIIEAQVTYTAMMTDTLV